MATMMASAARVSLLGLLLVACAGSQPTIIGVTATPGGPGYAKFVFDVIDDATGQAVTSDITIRRETTDGEPIGTEEFYTGAHVEIEAPVDSNAYIWLLVEAKGYQDWELKLKAKQPGTLRGPIRLKALIAPTRTPGPQASSPERVGMN